MEYCSSTCLHKYFPEENCNKVIKLGSSKNKNIGYVHDNSLIIEREAKDWTEEHLYGVAINRDKLRRDNWLLDQISLINHKNIMRIYSYCNCSVEVEYIDGWIFNSHKPSYILFDKAYQLDYLDICSKRELLNSIKTIIKSLCLIHSFNLIHTDLTDFNVMVRRSTKDPVIIDLLGMIPNNHGVFNERMDIWVFVHHFLVPTLTRLHICKSKEIIEIFTDYNYKEIIGFVEDLYKKMLQI
ncbi:RIO1 family regulatory kinase/ATPase [Bacillus pacificus]|uniref:RIO1 family regulatory kinase/ATPase domain-containing protein n=1 Tax=Bacillus pacificus TaxID=2026187 RepID=UPI002E21ADFF|nr:hypothetical protein [Bacillus pacificus]